MKKIIIFTIFFSFLSSFSFALGTGVQAGAGPSFDVDNTEVQYSNLDVSLIGTIKFFRIPAVFGFGIEAEKLNSETLVGASTFFDYWILDCQLHNTWNLYSGVGISAKFLMDSNKNSAIDLGPRIFIGSNWLFLDNYIEYYVQLNAVPSYFKNLSGGNGTYRLSTPIETGVRLHY